MYYDYYKILNVSPNATQEDIKRAYRLKAKAHHPDVNSSANANQLFALINEAYEVLSDENKRFKFDLKYKYKKATYSNTEQTEKKGENFSKRKRQNFHYDWNSYAHAGSKYKVKDMHETHPVLFHLLFLFGMFIGFVLTLVTILGTYLRLWPFFFIVIVGPGIILIVEGFNGIVGKKTRYDKVIYWVLRKLNRNR